MKVVFPTILAEKAKSESNIKCLNKKSLKLSFNMKDTYALQTSLYKYDECYNTE